MQPATADQVLSALAAPSPWPVALTADDSFVAPDRLTGVAERICARLGGAPARVGESTYVLGLAARLWSATLGPLARSGVLPDPAAFHVRDDHGAVELALTEPRGWTDVTPADLHAEVTAVLRTVIAPPRLRRRQPEHARGGGQR